MQITAELIDQDIKMVQERINALSQQLELDKALLAQAGGALSTLNGFKDYLLKPDAPLPAVPIQDIAEAVAGPGATVEIVPVDPTPVDPTAGEVVNANGMYVEKQNG